MGRREDIEEQLNKDYELLKNLEDRQRTETDPKLELRLNGDIGKLKQQIDNRQKELETLSSSSVPNQNVEDIKNSDKESSPVTMTFNAPVYGVAGNVQGNQNVSASEQKQPLAGEEIQDVHKQQQKILILSAIPHGLRLDKEIREIEEAIRRAEQRNLFEIRMRTAVRPQDIRRAIAEEQPQIVHFCGHGLEDGNLLLEDEGGKDKPVAPEALASLFKLHADSVKCVLLNACYSEKPADAISQHIDYVIGMNNPIQDKAAIEFAKGFYDGIGYELLNKQDVFQRAFDEAMVAIQMENVSQANIPVLKKKVIIEPNSIYPPLFEIPVTGEEASEVGDDYTKLRDFLQRREFGKADLETTRRILWVAKQEQEGWLDVEDIENFPSQDLLTVNRLWLVASQGKFGFSVQKQIWVNLGGKPGEEDLNIFWRFLKEVEWAENKIIFDQRAAKGHLPVGVFVKVSQSLGINQKWWVEIDKIAQTREEEIEEERKRMKDILEERRRGLDTEECPVWKGGGEDYFWFVAFSVVLILGVLLIVAKAQLGELVGYFVLGLVIFYLLWLFGVVIFLVLDRIRGCVDDSGFRSPSPTFIEQSTPPLVSLGRVYLSLLSRDDL